MPEYRIERLQITGRSDAVIEMTGQGHYQSNSSLRKTLKTTAVQTEEESPELDVKFDRHVFRQLFYLGVDYVMSPHNMEMKIFMVTMLTMMILMFVYFRNQVRNFILVLRRILRLYRENCLKISSKVFSKVGPIFSKFIQNFVISAKGDKELLGLHSVQAHNVSNQKKKKKTVYSVVCYLPNKCTTNTLSQMEAEIHLVL